jgi:hypothetical protein
MSEGDAPVVPVFEGDPLAAVSPGFVGGEFGCAWVSDGAPPPEVSVAVPPVVALAVAVVWGESSRGFENVPVVAASAIPPVVSTAKATITNIFAAASFATATRRRDRFFAAGMTVAASVARLEKSARTLPSPAVSARAPVARAAASS